MPPIPAEAAPTSLVEKRPIMHFASETSKYASICSLDAKYSFLFVSLLFFTQKYFSLNPLTKHIVPLTDEHWTNLKPLIPPTKSAGGMGAWVRGHVMRYNCANQMVVVKNSGA